MEEVQVEDTWLKLQHIGPEYPAENPETLLAVNHKTLWCWEDLRTHPAVCCLGYFQSRRNAKSSLLHQPWLWAP